MDFSTRSRAIATEKALMDANGVGGDLTTALKTNKYCLLLSGEKLN